MTKSAASIVENVSHYADKASKDRAAERTKLAEKLATDFMLTSFDYDGMMDVEAKADVWVSLKNVIEYCEEAKDEYDAEKIVQELRRTVSRYITHNVTSRSSSGSQNAMYAATHAEWVEAFKIVF